MNYYNEFDPFAANWLKELIKDDLIPEGEVDERSIIDVEAGDLRGFTQCHFFAGIGGWSYALALAGWSPDRPIWTGSPPCQPFSHAGKQKGVDDERHLWPHFFELIEQCKPSTVIGEQVASAIRHEWFDDLQTDMEKAGYATGMAVLPACSVNAPHKRDRLFFVAYSESERLQGHGGSEQILHQEGWSDTVGHSAESSQYSLPLGKSDSDGCEQGGEAAKTTRHGSSDDSASGDDSTLGNTKHDGSYEPEIRRSTAETGNRSEEGQNLSGEFEGTGRSGKPGNIRNWSDSEVIYCRDGKYRPTPPQSYVQSVADGLSGAVAEVSLETLEHGFPLTSIKHKNFTGILKGAGNAIVPQVAAEFVSAFMEVQNG